MRLPSKRRAQLILRSLLLLVPGLLDDSTPKGFMTMSVLRHARMGCRTGGAHGREVYDERLATVQRVMMAAVDSLEMSSDDKCAYAAALAQEVINEEKRQQGIMGGGQQTAPEGVDSGKVRARGISDVGEPSPSRRPKSPQRGKFA